MDCIDPAIYTLQSIASSVSREKWSKREGMSTMTKLEVEDRLECSDRVGCEELLGQMFNLSIVKGLRNHPVELKFRSERVTSPPSGCEEGLHPQAIKHAQHT
jgi:hypothetical protein